MRRIANQPSHPIAEHVLASSPAQLTASSSHFLAPGDGDEMRPPERYKHALDGILETGGVGDYHAGVK
jgi:hypothetical protein